MGNTPSQQSLHRAGSNGSILDKRQKPPDHYPGVPFVKWQGTYHFAEPSSYKYNGRSIQVNNIYMYDYNTQALGYI